MKGTPVDELVYAYLYPRPRPTDPSSFQVLLHHHLLPEVRNETKSFYGDLDTQEVKYPGLDYTHRTHRIRLSRWPWHRRLFRAFGALGLTHAEVASLTRWEGTLWAKQRFEKDQGVVIRDTTDDDIAEWTAHADGLLLQPDEDEAEQEVDEAEAEHAEEEDEFEFQSVGDDLNSRLRDRATRREAGEPVVLDEEWEQWLKDAIESGQIGLLSEQLTQSIMSRAGDTLVPAALVPPRMLSSARNGHWADIPDTLHPLLQRILDAERPRRRMDTVAAGVNAF